MRESSHLLGLDAAAGTRGFAHRLRQPGGIDLDKAARVLW